MNKLLIVLLAVCLFGVVSAHAFVKRDAPATPDVTAQLKAFQEQFAQLASEFSKKITESVNPDTIKKNVNDFIDAAAKTAQNFKPVADDKPAA